MSYYQPFYYPYYSARPDLPPSLLELDRKLALYPSIQPSVTTALIDQQARQIEINEIAHRTFAQAEMQRMNEERMVRVEIEAQLEMKREGDYLQRIAALRRERQLLDTINRPGLTVRDKDEFTSNEKHMTDDELLKYYSSGQKFQQYQRQMRQRINSAQPKEKNQKQRAISAKLAFSQQTENSPKRREYGKGNAVQDERDRLIEQAIKRSYIDELKQSKGHGSIQKPIKDQTLRGDTIDLLPLSKIQSPFTHKYGVTSKSKKTRKGNHSISHHNDQKKKQFKAMSHIGTTTNRTFTATTLTEAMKKINNRLQVSSIVYKDSKLRNQRHQMDHLLNTFQNELKGRKQVKDKINTHPDILKKHNMVVKL